MNVRSIKLPNLAIPASGTGRPAARTASRITSWCCDSMSPKGEIFGDETVTLRPFERHFRNLAEDADQARRGGA